MSSSNTPTRAPDSGPSDHRPGEPDPVGVNHAVVVGELVTEPVLRELPGGDPFLSFSLTVRRPGAATTSVPLVWYRPPAGSRRWRLSDRIVVVGSVVRRFYRAGGYTQSRTEVVVDRAVVAGRTGALKKTIDTALSLSWEDLVDAVGVSGLPRH